MDASEARTKGEQFPFVWIIATNNRPLREQGDFKSAAPNRGANNGTCTTTADSQTRFVISGVSLGNTCIVETRENISAYGGNMKMHVRDGGIWVGLIRNLQNKTLEFLIFIEIQVSDSHVRATKRGVRRVRSYRLD